MAWTKLEKWLQSFRYDEHKGNDAFQPFFNRNQSDRLCQAVQSPFNCMTRLNGLTLLFLCCWRCCCCCRCWLFVFLVSGVHDKTQQTRRIQERKIAVSLRIFFCCCLLNTRYTVPILCTSTRAFPFIFNVFACEWGKKKQSAFAKSKWMKRIYVEIILLQMKERINEKKCGK